MSPVVHHCHEMIESGASLPAMLFMAGLAGSVTHCLGMCGPFVLGQAADQAERELGPRVTLRRLAGLALLPYHAGRATTYVVLGIAAGAMASTLREAAWFKTFSAVMLGLAGLLFLASALYRWGVRIPLVYLIPPSLLERLSRPLFKSPTGWGGFRLGLALGLLPCGLVYAALMAVMAHGDPLMAGIGMACFALGTFPALAALSVLGDTAFRRFHRLLTHLTPSLMALNSMALFYMSGELFP
ncbi:MAG: sulfite exporter TauE/SafE family protein [Bdellovibrionales bacterium]